MSYARVGIWKINPGNDHNQLVSYLRDTLLPEFQRQPGFVSFVAIASGDDTAVGVQVWESEQHATQAGSHNGDQARQHVGDRATLESWFHGPVTISISEQPIEKAGYGRVGIWNVAPSANRQELTEKAREALIPMYRNSGGLVSYLAVDSAEGKLVVAHTWETEQQSERGMQASGQWLQETLATQISLLARYDGRVAAAAGKQ
jgi:quinol monooxygenase YgiN